MFRENGLYRFKTYKQVPIIQYSRYFKNIFVNDF